MIKEAVVLAGGFGTRLQAVVSEVPKPMAPVAGKPFLQYVLDALAAQGITHTVLAVGYLREVIIGYFGNVYNGMQISYSEEIEPLGTGGGILQACNFIQGDTVFVVNGDTYFDVPLQQLAGFHRMHNAMLTIALKPMQQFDRYGTVELNAEGVVTAFREKKFMQQGNINGGVYCLNKKIFQKTELKRFSFETEILERSVTTGKISGMVFDTYFIDIGIPEDYDQAQTDFAQQHPGAGRNILPQIDKTWTLFLDRDGVINRKIDHDYVRNVGLFEWLPGAVSALVQFAALFGRIIIVTNQRGVGRGLMTTRDLEEIHTHLKQTIHAAGGRIDAIYYCTDTEDAGSTHRKPQTGMALDARRDFPEINFKRSVIAGDSTGDILFGRNLEMFTIQVGGSKDLQADCRVVSLAEMASLFVNLKAD